MSYYLVIFSTIFLQVGSQFLQLPAMTAFRVGQQFVKQTPAAFGGSTLEVALSLLDAPKFTIGGKGKSLGCTLISLDFWHDV
jgi:hypothetical protein